MGNEVAVAVGGTGEIEVGEDKGVMVGAAADVGVGGGVDVADAWVHPRIPIPIMLKTRTIALKTLFPPLYACVMRGS